MNVNFQAQLLPPPLPSNHFQNKKWPTYKDFNFTKNESTLLLNHGSFGGTPNQVINYRNQLQDYFQKIQFSLDLTKKEVENIQFGLYENWIKKTGEFLKIEDCKGHVVVDHNATACLNTILRFEFKIDKNEVEKVFDVPFKSLLNDLSQVKIKISNEYMNENNVPAFKFNDNIVWGATAMILSEFKFLLKLIKI